MLDAINIEVLFPPRLIPELLGERGDGWRNLVKEVRESPAVSLEQAAFVLMMVRLSGCNTCHANSFRALQGCEACARQSLRRSRSSDEELIQAYHQARQEVTRFLSTRAESETAQV